MISGKYRVSEEKKLSMLIGLHFMWMAVLSFAVTILKHRGIRAENIGILTSIPPLLSVVIQYCTGMVIDKNGGWNILIRILRAYICLGIFGMLFFLKAETSFLLLVMAFVLFGFGMYSTSPLFSTIAIQYEKHEVPVRYSVARGIGSFVYGVGCVCLGYLIQSHDGEVVLGIGVLTGCFMLFVSFGLRDKFFVSRRPRESAITGKKFPISYWIYLFASFFIFVGHFLLNTYMIHLVELLGGNNRHLGYTQLILSVCEVPVAMLFPGLKKHFGVKVLVVVSAIFMFIKILGNAIAPTLVFLMFVQILQFLGNGLYWSTSVHFVNEVVPETKQAQGQSLLFMACSGVSGFLASYCGGKILEYAAVILLKEVAVLSGFVGMVLMMVSVIRIKKVV